MQDREINGFLIDEFNQHGPRREDTGYMPFVFS